MGKTDDSLKKRSLNHASKTLYRLYGYKYDEVTNPIPDEAIFEQALWILKLDDSLRKSEQGVKSIMVDGIQVVLARINRTIAPQVIHILGRKIGRSSSGRTGEIVK